MQGTFLKNFLSSCLAAQVVSHHECSRFGLACHESPFSRISLPPPSQTTPPLRNPNFHYPNSLSASASKASSRDAKWASKVFQGVLTVLN